MAGLGAALVALGENRSRRKAEELKQVELEIEQKKVSLMEQQNNLAKQDMAFKAIGIIAGEEGITPKRKEAITKSFSDQFGLDVSEMFRPNTDEKTGVVDSFGIENVDTFTTKLQANVAKMQDETKKADLYLSTIKEAREREEFEYEKTKSPDKFEAAKIGALVTTKEYLNATPEERVNMIDKAWWCSPTTASATTPLSSQAKADADKTLKSSIMQSADLNIIDKTIDDKFLTWAGKAKSFLIDAALKGGKEVEKMANITPEDKEYIGKFARFIGATNRIANQYVNAISGAAFSVKEIERYQKSIMDTSQNYVAYRANLEDYKEFVKRGYRLSQYARDKGYAEKDLQSTVDNLIERTSSLPSTDPTTDPAYVREIGDKIASEIMLKNPKISQQDAEKAAAVQLFEMGYIK